MPDSRTKVSGVIPTHNAANHIVDLLDSIDAQTRPLDQLVISDDASTDQTLPIIAEYQQTANYELKLISHQPSGPTANYLNAVSHASGDLVLIGDHDDVWDPGRVESIVSAFGDSAVSLVCHDSELVDSRLRKLGSTVRGGRAVSRKLSRKINRASDADNLQMFLRGGLPLLAHTLAFRGSLAPLVLNKPGEIEDWWFEEWVSCVAMTQGRLHFIEEPLVKYRQHANQSSGGYGQAISVADITPREKYINRIRKIRHCAGSVSHPGSARSSIMANYASFLEQRQGALTRQSLGTAMTLLITGNYSKYAKGIRSFFVDVLTIIGVRA